LKRRDEDQIVTLTRDLDDCRKDAEEYTKNTSMQGFYEKIEMHKIELKEKDV
jgi:hypothetical protein